MQGRMLYIGVNNDTWQLIYIPFCRRPFFANKKQFSRIPCDPRVFLLQSHVIIFFAKKKKYFGELRLRKNFRGISC